MFLLLNKKSKHTPNGIGSFTKVILLEGKAIRKIFNLQLVHIFTNFLYLTCTINQCGFEVL